MRPEAEEEPAWQDLERSSRPASANEGKGPKEAGVIHAEGKNLCYFTCVRGAIAQT